MHSRSSTGGKQTFTHDTGAQGLNIAWTLDGLVLAVMNKVLVPSTARVLIERPHRFVVAWLRAAFSERRGDVL